MRHPPSTRYKHLPRTASNDTCLHQLQHLLTYMVYNSSSTKPCFRTQKIIDYHDLDVPSLSMEGVGGGWVGVVIAVEQGGGTVFAVWGSVRSFLVFPWKRRFQFLGSSLTNSNILTPLWKVFLGGIVCTPFLSIFSCERMVFRQVAILLLLRRRSGYFPQRSWPLERKCWAEYK